MSPTRRRAKALAALRQSLPNAPEEYLFQVLRKQKKAGKSRRISRDEIPNRRR